MNYVWLCDLACLLKTRKRLPNNCLHIIFISIINKFPTKAKSISTKSDYELIDKGSHKKKWQKKNLSKVRIKRAFRWW